MFVLLIASCIAMILAYYASRDEIPFGLELAFLLVGFVAVIHYNYGNDYKEYYALYNAFIGHQFDWDLIVQKKFYKEPGWFLINYLFSPFGFFSLVAFLSVLQNFIYYLLVKLYVPKEWWVMGVFIYLFNDSLYVINMSMMRQGLTVALFVLAWILLDRSNRYLTIVSILLIFIASTIHNSAMVLYPCLLITFLNKKNAPYYAVGILFLFVLLFVMPDLINAVFLQFSDLEDVQRLLSKYENSSSKLSYGVGFALMLLPFAAMFFFLVKSDLCSSREIQIIALVILTYSIMPFRASIPLISRMAYYFTAFSIPAIPIVAKKMPYPYMIFFLTSFTVLTLYQYFKFFTSETYIKSYMHFHSIFEVIF